MSMLFPRWMNAIPTAVGIGGALLVVGVSAVYMYYFTPEFWRVGYEPIQPVDYSHQLHAGTLGIDCRYCHSDVEKSPHANVPDVETCMNCHTGVGEQSFLNATKWQAHKVNPNLIQVREAAAAGTPIRWRRIHKAPDYVQFNHAIHVNAGVSCFSCHGRVDQLAHVRQVHGMGMQFCLDCHREPERFIVAADDDPATPAPRITDLGAIEALLAQPGHVELGRAMIENRKVQPAESCGTCHY